MHCWYIAIPVIIISLSFSYRFRICINVLRLVTVYVESSVPQNYYLAIIHLWIVCQMLLSLDYHSMLHACARGIIILPWQSKNSSSLPDSDSLTMLSILQFAIWMSKFLLEFGECKCTLFFLHSFFALLLTVLQRSSLLINFGLICHFNNIKTPVPHVTSARVY